MTAVPKKKDTSNPAELCLQDDIKCQSYFTIEPFTALSSIIWDNIVN
jgi:hypothetical protein